MWPDQIVLALVVLGIASLVPAVRSRDRGPALAAGVTAIAGLVLFLGPFQDPRLLIFRQALPLAPPPVSPPLTPASCLCATRRTLLDMFGRPDFIRASMVGDRYAYWVWPSDGDVVIYHLETREESLGDRVLRIDYRTRVSMSDLEREGLIRPAAPGEQPPGG